jgi:hypothetical protein
MQQPDHKTRPQPTAGTAGPCQQNGARSGSGCFRLRFRNDPAQLGPASDAGDGLRFPPCSSGAAASSCRRARSARRSPCSLSPRCFTCAQPIHASRRRVRRYS